MSRIYESCISSEDIKHECGADKLFSYVQGGIGVTIIKNDEWIGYIDHFEIYLGDDYIIKKIVLYKNEELSKKLSEKYRGKILISSNFKDSVS